MGTISNHPTVLYTHPSQTMTITVLNADHSPVSLHIPPKTLLAHQSPTTTNNTIENSTFHPTRKHWKFQNSILRGKQTANKWAHKYIIKWPIKYQQMANIMYNTRTTNTRKLKQNTRNLQRTLSNRFYGHSLVDSRHSRILMRIIRLLATGRRPVWIQRAIAKAEAVSPLTVFPPLLAAMRRRLPKAKTCYFPKLEITHSLLAPAIGW